MAKRKRQNSAPPSPSEQRELEKEADEVASEQEEGKEEFGRENP